MPNESLIALAVLAVLAVSLVVAVLLNEARKAEARRQKFRRPFPTPDFGDLAGIAEKTARKAGQTLPLF